MKRTPFFSVIASLVFLSVTAQAADKQRQLWITNAYGNDVHIYEVDSWKLIRQFKVGSNPHGISATADGRTAHIAIENFGSPEGELIWIDTQTGKITDRIAVGPKPNENECTPDGKWIYVPCNDGQYWVIDGEKKTVVAKIKTGGRPHNTTVSANGKRMYLSPGGGSRSMSCYCPSWPSNYEGVSLRRRPPPRRSQSTSSSTSASASGFRSS